MTTLLLSENFPPKVGGSSRWFWEIYRRLPRDNFLVAAGEDPQGDLFDSTHDLRVFRLPLTLPHWGIRSVTGIRGYGQALNAVRKIAKKQKVQRLHCGRCLPEGWIAWLVKQWDRIPYACYVHGEELNTSASSREFRWMTHRVFRGADFLIANSQNTAQILIQEWQVSEDRVRQLYPGVATDRFVPAPRNPSIRSSLKWGERRVILTVGRLQKRKGHDQMILALNEIQKSVPDVLYSIVGEGEERSALEELVKQQQLSDHVQFLSAVDDQLLVQSYQQCDLFVLPNRQVEGDFEGFGMVLLEAQACGKPVVAGESGGTVETMQVSDTGRIVSCDDWRELSAVVVELLKDPDLRERMGIAARDWVKSRFDWDALSRQAEAIFRNERPHYSLQAVQNV